MRRVPTLRAALILTMVGASLGLVVVSGRGQDPAPKGSRAAFMRQKLEYAKDLLEGLTVEDYAKIEKSAKALKRLSSAAEWEVPTIPNYEEYAPLTVEFQRITDEIVKAADRKNIDAATLGYVRLTTNCVNCHKYVREVIK